MIKPFFLYWAHKEMWERISSVCKQLEELEPGLLGSRRRDLRIAASELRASVLQTMLKEHKKFSGMFCYIKDSLPNEKIVGDFSYIRSNYSIGICEEKNELPIYMSFACQAKSLFPKENPRPSLVVGCPKECPLFWGSRNSNNSCGNLDTEWMFALSKFSSGNRLGNHYRLPSEIALEIANLPLKHNAHNHYVIVESPRKR